MDPRRIITAFAIVAAVILLSGASCRKNSNTRHIREENVRSNPTLIAENERLLHEITMLKKQLNDVDLLVIERNNEIAKWKGMYDNAQTQLAAQADEIDRLTTLTHGGDYEKDKLETELANLQDKVTELEGIIAKRDSKGNLVLVLDNKLFFKSGSAVLNKTSQSTLTSVAGILNDSYPDKKIRIDGHADSDPIKTAGKKFKTNWELSSARSLAVLHFLHGKGGVKEARMSSRSFSYFKPVADNDTPKNKAKNRRVEIVILNS
ncbi:OmpA family protein [Planctomycetota bacterium]